MEHGEKVLDTIKIFSNGLLVLLKTFLHLKMGGKIWTWNWILFEFEFGLNWNVYEVFFNLIFMPTSNLVLEILDLSTFDIKLSRLSLEMSCES